MRKNGSPLPSFATDEDRTWFRVRLPAHPSVLSGASEASNEQGTEQDNQLEDKEKSIRTPMRPNKIPNKLSVWYSY